MKTKEQTRNGRRQLPRFATLTLHLIRRMLRPGLVLFPAVIAASAAQAGETNWALNTSGSGFPSPLESDAGWGGGSYPWQIVDGQQTYDQWYHGLAFTGGSGSYAGPAGPRQATISFGANRTFHKVVLWHHGPDGVNSPADDSLAYWSGTNWVGIPFQRSYGALVRGGAGSISDEYTFAPVNGSKVRWSFDNRLNNVVGTQINTGWIYEFEVYGYTTADLILRQVAPVQVNLNGNFTYTLQVSNAGPSDATGVRVTDVVPSLVALTAVSSSQGSQTASSNSFTADLGTLAVGATAAVQVQGRARCYGSGFNFAQVTANETDPVSANNQVLADLKVTGPEQNVALNASGSGFPSPLESDRGWGGGSYPWEVLDGQRTYAEWYHGLAFTGGHGGGGPGDGWIEAPGPRQATVNFGADQTFYKVVVWHHGADHAPATASLEYWNGSQWTALSARRRYGAIEAGGAGSISDEYLFEPVTGSKVRWNFDNSGDNVLGNPIVHGWIYEIEVMAAGECDRPTLNLKRMMAVEVAGSPGKPYRIEYTPALATPPAWQELITLTLSNSPQIYVDLGSLDAPLRFYRVVPAP